MTRAPKENATRGASGRAIKATVPDRAAKAAPAAKPGRAGRKAEPARDPEAVEATKAVGSARAAKAARSAAAAAGATGRSGAAADPGSGKSAAAAGSAGRSGPTAAAGSAGAAAGKADPAAGAAGSAAANPGAAGKTAERISVRKTYKLYIGGAFPRSESGRSYAVSDVDGRFLANAAQASRKDVRDAVVAARKAQPGWAKATAYNRGQVLYRVAEMLEGRRAQFVAEVDAAGGTDAESEVDAAIDRWVWYAGWSDKVTAVLGAVNPVAGPYFDFSLPEPTGVVGVLAPQRSALLGLVSVVAPVIATGNTCVVVASGDRPLPAITLAEVLATSDLPGGVVNLLTGSAAELAPWLAAHADVNALDLTGADPDQLVDLEQAAAQTVKRVLPAPAAEPDWTADPGTRRLSAFLETKTVWHPVGV